MIEVLRTIAGAFWAGLMDTAEGDELTKIGERFDAERADRLQAAWSLRCAGCGLRFTFTQACMERAESFPSEYVVNQGWQHQEALMFECPGCVERKAKGGHTFGFGPCGDRWLTRNGWTARGCGRWSKSYRCPACAELVR